MAKKEDHALFHIDGGFIPYLSEDTIDLIHKKPQNFNYLLNMCCPLPHVTKPFMIKDYRLTVKNPPL